MKQNGGAGYRLAVDIGGTFTDVVLETPDGWVSGKVLTTGHAPEEGVVTGVRLVLDKAGVAADKLDFIIHGTTLATNAIIERRGARTALITTEGFRDTLEFAFGQRFDQYDLELERPEPLIARPLRFEAHERTAADGSVLISLEEEGVRALARKLRDQEIESVAVCFMHAYRNGAHERRVREILNEEAPDLFVSLSHEVCPEIREYERTSTTVANAYVQPLMATYLGKLDECLRELGARAPLLMIMSSGSLTSVETAQRFPIRLVESGPAGGAILARQIAMELGATRAVALDMGGTTAKIILLTDYEPRHARSMEVARAYRFLPGSGLPLRIPVIEMIEIGAGGGSIAHVDELGRIAVGPESAGSSPGPACYGLGGSRPTVTDSDLLQGKLDPDAFAGGTMRLDTQSARSAVEAHVGAPIGIGWADAAAGVCEIVDENMSNATRVHAADAGEELESRVLIATGGAGPLHAARIAEKLGMSTVVVPKAAGVGSAFGFLKAPIAYEAVHSQIVHLASFEAEAVNRIFANLRTEAEKVVRLASGNRPLRERRFADMRYRGQGHELAVELPARDYENADGEVLTEVFEAQYQKNYGRRIPNLSVEALTWTLVLSAIDDDDEGVGEALEPATSEAPVLRTTQVFDAEVGDFVTARVIARDASPAGARFDGPALVVEDQTTIWTPTSFEGRISRGGHVILQRKTNA
ncbi:MAG: hydantoinase/oxoprolinase family protein [Beijerinckiaceae bacterium]